MDSKPSPSAQKKLLPEHQKASGSKVDRDCKQLLTSEFNRIEKLTWDERNSMAAEKRKHLERLRFEHSPMGSAHSSPMIARNKAGKSPGGSTPNTPQLLHVPPKYRFPNESLSVSHEDLVNASDGNHDDDDDIDSQSIFHTPKMYRRFQTS